MTGSFPLVLLPKRVVYVDDDGRMLDILRMTMPKKTSREFIGSPDAALQTLSQEAQYWRAVERLLARGGGSANLYASSYFTDWRRFHLTEVLIVDYAMPGLTGLELVRRLEAFPARRILLTGEADAEVAVQAFNAGLIQRFIPKSTPNLHKEITRSADEMHMSLCNHFGQLLHRDLSQEQIELLLEPSVIKGLTAKVEELEWMEYVVVGSPFGLLGMSQTGPLQWLQLDTSESLKDLSTALAESGYSGVDIQAAAMCTATPVREIRQQLGLPDDRELVPTDVISDVPELLGAVIDLPLEVVTARDYGVDDIRTPAELMRCLLRDVFVASQREGDRSGLDEAIANLVSTATLSQIHSQALTASLPGARLPPEIAAQVEAQVSIGIIRGKINGKPR